jgi:hypothetical protein
MTAELAYEPSGTPLLVTAQHAPEIEPPYEPLPPVVVRIEGALALAGAVPVAAPALWLVPEPEGDAEDDGEFDPVRSERSELEDPRPRATVLARALLETLCGDRPVGQLMRWTTPEVFAQLEPLAAARPARNARPWAATVRRVLVSEPAAGVAEVTAVIQRGPRAGALALRLEGLDGRWVVTALHVG